MRDAVVEMGQGNARVATDQLHLFELHHHLKQIVASSEVGVQR
jgi:hypothetical protein